MSGFRKRSVSKYIRLFAAAFCACSLLAGPDVPARAAAPSAAELLLEANRALPVQSDEIPGWPAGPVIGAESAILMEARTGAILYSKNIHMREYPASTTKILTALIAAERCQMDEIVTFSHDAVFDTPWDSSHIAMDVGQELTMEQCLNAILIRSANEVCYAVAEHITSTTDWQVFSGIMNDRAAQLGCLNTHFVNPNGLPDDDHYTTAYDLAMIGRAFFANEMLCKITLSPRIDFPPTDKLPQGKLENNHMEIIPGGTYAYEHIVGCKTGYTEDARSCLVSCAEKNGLKLICVVMRDESPYHYEDTITLFEYGFSNFDKVYVSQAETKYNIDNTGLFYGGGDIFGSTKPFLSLNKDDFIVLPRSVPFAETQSSISYETGDESQAAVIAYTYQGVALGTVRVDFTASNENTNIFDTEEESPDAEADKDNPIIFINVAVLFTGCGILAVLLIIWLIVRLILKNYNISPRNGRRSWRKKNRRRRRNSRKHRGYDF